MVDIIIPTYKARHTLPAALDSLVAQTKKMFIVTIVQDADGEDYSDILEEYRRRGLKIRLVQMEENGGPGLARQRGMDTDPMSEFFMFMDADDILNPRAVEILSREIKLNNADIGISNFMVDRKADLCPVMDVDNTPCTWCHGKIYRAGYLRDMNIRFFPTLRLNEDSYFNLVAVNCTRNKVKIHETTYLWMQTPDSLTRKDGEINFFVKSWAQYIFSQVQGLEDIIDRMGKIDPCLVGATLINIYGHHMKAISSTCAEECKGEFDFVKKELARLGRNETIVKAIHSENFWKYIAGVLKGCEMFAGNLIFYNMRFCDWIRAYVVEELV